MVELMTINKALLGDSLDKVRFYFTFQIKSTSMFLG
jgi:hypothetical protein